jgi:hypothetical protein
MRNLTNCQPTNPPRDCCADFASICEATTFGQPVLRSDLSTNCGGTARQWRLQKTFDLSGLGAAQVCFDLASQAASTTEGALLWASDGAHPGGQQLACTNDSVVPGVDLAWVTACADLPSWAADNPGVTLTFLLHSSANGSAMFLDNVRVAGWAGGCTPTVSTALDEDFAGCDTTGWTVTGAFNCASSNCSNQPGWAPGIAGNDSPFTMDTTLDAGPLDSEVTICAQLGLATGAPAGDSISLLYDAGAGWQPAWQQGAPTGATLSCWERCVNLSDLDPAVNNHPALRLRFEVDSAGALALYGVRVTGSPACPAGAAVTLSSPPADQGGGSYGFTATDAAGGPLTTKVQCAWSPDPVIAGSDSIRFVP